MLTKILEFVLILTVFCSPHDACVWQCIPPNGYLNGLSDEQPWYRIKISSLCSECPFPCPPPSELSSHALCVSSRSSPFAVSHHQHHHYHHHSTCNSDFSTSNYSVLNGMMKVTGSSIYRYRKSDFGVCANTDRVFFPRTMRVSDNIPPNGSLNRLSDN